MRSATRPTAADVQDARVLAALPLRYLAGQAHRQPHKFRLLARDLAIRQASMARHVGLPRTAKAAALAADLATAAAAPATAPDDLARVLVLNGGKTLGARQLLDLLDNGRAVGWRGR